jgi:hypothetical protein
MIPVASNHDTGAKRILGGTVLPGGQSADTDLQQTLDTIFTHPNVGPFIGKQLIQHLITANPSPAYLSRISAVFADDGHGVRGNLGAVVRAILLDPEARGDTKPDPSYGRVKDPVLLLTGLARALGVTTDGVYFANVSSALEQPVYQAPSVFSFYPPDYTLPAGLLSPASALMDSPVFPPNAGGSCFTHRPDPMPLWPRHRHPLSWVTWPGWAATRRSSPGRPRALPPRNHVQRHAGGHRRCSECPTPRRDRRVGP